MELGNATTFNNNEQLSNATKIYCETACLQLLVLLNAKKKGAKKNANSGQQKDLSSHTAATGILVLRYVNIISLHLV